MREALRIDFNELILHDKELDAAEKIKIEKWTADRLAGVPLAYLSGKKGFHKYEFNVRSGVLVPRPETELLVDAGISRIQRGARIKIADLGCGSGCVGISLLKEIEGSELSAVDISPIPCSLTAENAKLLGVAERTQVFQSDVISWKPAGLFELIVANPPYIANGDPAVEPAVDKFEPHEALYSGVDGLNAIRAWVNWAPDYLQSNGIMALEIGTGQSAQVEEIMAKAGFEDIQIIKDFAGHDRIISGKRGSTNG